MLVKYPYQESLANFGCINAAAQSAMLGLTQEQFYRFFPFHFILDRDCKLLQVRAAEGAAVHACVRGMRVRHA